MKQTKVIISILLIVLIVIGWGIKINSIINDTNKYNKNIENADYYLENKLYQKAIAEYQEALNIKESIEVRNKYLDAYSMAYEDEVVTRSEYLKALEETCGIYPKYASYWEWIIEVCVNTNQYENAYSYYKKSVNKGVKSEKLTYLGDVVQYSYTLKNKVYTKKYRNSDGIYTLYNENKWGVMSASGDWKYECSYDFASPVSKNSEVILSTDKDTRELKGSDVVQNYVNEEINECKAPSEDIVLINKDGWRFYDCNKNEYILMNYEDASVFMNNKAFVKKSGKWHLIDKNGNDTSDTQFDNVKLFDSGEYLYDDYFLASVNGTYGLYNKSGKKKTDIQGTEVDLYLGEEIAFKGDNGKWGFINSNNKVVIEPQYDDAKSFSNGLAAVKMNGKWGFINKEGRNVIDYQFVDADYFTSEGLCFVSFVKDEYCQINLKFKRRK